MSDLLLDDHMNPDCLAGAHRACRGDAWDFENDCETDCACFCHIDAEEAVA